MAKYHNKKVNIDGEILDSKREATRFLQLRRLEEIGEIQGLRRQVRYELIPTQRDKATGRVLERSCTYVADFVYEQDGLLIVEDTKGMRTAEYIIKRKLMLKNYGIRVREI